jgi:hypothetical protein
MTETISSSLIKRCRRHLIEWNLFTSDDQQDGHDLDPRLLREQRISSRIYVISMTS